MYKLCHKCRLPYQAYKGTACNCISKTYINDIASVTENDVIKSIQQACIDDITRCIAQQRSMSHTIATLKQYSALFH